MQAKTLLSRPGFTGVSLEIAVYWCMILVAAFAAGVSMFGGTALALVFVVMALFPLLLWLQQRDSNIMVRSPLNKLVWLMLGYMLCSCLWSIDSKGALHLWLRLAFLFVAAISVYAAILKMSAQHRQQILATLVVGCCVALAVANVEIWTNGLLNRLAKWGDNAFVFDLVRLNRGSVFAALLVWPVVAYLLAKRQKIVAFLFVLAVCLTIGRLSSQTAQLATVASILAYAIVYVLPKFGTRLIAAGLVVGSLLFIVAAKQVQTDILKDALPSIPGGASEYRLEIWHFTAQQAALKPFWGWGLDAARDYPVEKYQFVLENRHPLPLHPHNSILQVWLELGAVGVGLLLVSISMVLLTINRMACGRVNEACFVALVVSYYSAGFTGFGVWQNWWIGAGLIALGFMYMAVTSPMQTKPTNASSSD